MMTVNAIVSLIFMLIASIVVHINVIEYEKHRIERKISEMPPEEEKVKEARRDREEVDYHNLQVPSQNHVADSPGSSPERTERN